MKRTVVFLSLVCSLFVLSTAFSGCSMTPDMMLQEYNGKLYEDIGGGIYITDGKPNIDTNLLNPVYRVMEHSLTYVKVDERFLDYNWTLIDNNSKESYNLGKSYFTYIEAAVLNLKKDGDYSLELKVTNRNNVLFMDTATVKVVNNIYN